MMLRKIIIDRSIRSIAKMKTSRANKLRLFQKRVIVNQTRERRMLLTKNFHKSLEKLLRLLQHEEDTNSLSK